MEAVVEVVTTVAGVMEAAAVVDAEGVVVTEEAAKSISTFE